MTAPQRMFPARAGSAAITRLSSPVQLHRPSCAPREGVPSGYAWCVTCERAITIEQFTTEGCPGKEPQ